MAAVAFKSALGRLGMTEQAAQNKVVEQGLDTIDDLTLLSATDVDKLTKALRESKDDEDGNSRMSMAHAKKFKGMWTWAVSQEIMSVEYTAGGFTGALITTWTKHATFIEGELKRLIDSPPSKPPKFVNFGKWRAFVEGLAGFYKQVRSSCAAGMPLIYLMRDHDQVTADIAEAVASSTIDEQLIDRVNLSHEICVEDNKRFYHLLAELTLETPAWVYVKKFAKTCDGRGAYKTLKAQAEGPAAITLQRAEARASMKGATYTGKGNFTFARYTAIFEEAFADLERLDEPVHESQKVQDFMDGIECPQLETFKKIVEGDEEKMNDFTKCQQFLQSCVNKTKFKPPRRVAGVRTTPGPGGKRGRSNSKQQSNKKTRRYSNAEWKALTDDERAKVRAAREAEKKKRAIAKAETESGGSKNQAQGGAVNVAGLVTALKELVTDQGKNGPDGQKSMVISVSSAKSTANKEQEQAIEPKKNAGHQFGRAGSKNQKPGSE